MPVIRTGDVAYPGSASQSRPSIVSVADSIVELELTLRGELVVTGALTLREDNILRLIRRIQVNLGGNPIKIIGDNSGLGAAFKILYYMNQLQYGDLPEFTAPGTGVATHTFEAAVRIPFSLPENLSKQLGVGRHASAMQAVEEDLEVVIDWGDTTDIFSAGTATLQNTLVEIDAVTDPNINPVPQSFQLKEQTQNLQLTAGANTNEPAPLNRQGTVPYIFLLGIDNSVRDDDAYNRLRFFRNNNELEMDKSWLALKANAKSRAKLQGAVLPVGISMAIFDQAMDMSQAIPVGDQAETKGWRVDVDHDALTNDFRLFAHHFALEMLPGAVEIEAQKAGR